MLYTRVLTFFCNSIDADPNLPPAVYIKELIARQMTMKKCNASSWVCHVQVSLPSTSCPRHTVSSTSHTRKEQWKHQVRDAINSVWTDRLRNEAHKKSTLKHLNINTCTADYMHPVWLDISSGWTSGKLPAYLAIYPLASCYLSLTAGPNTLNICPLCKTEPETTIHFLLHCPATSPT